MEIPECLPWKTYQGGSESLNPFILLSSCTYSCFKVSIRVWVVAMRVWCIPCSHMGPKQGYSEVKTARKKSAELGSGGRDMQYRTDGKGSHGSCLVSVLIFPKRSVFILSHLCKAEGLVACLGFPVKVNRLSLSWAFLLELDSLSIAVACLPPALCKLLPLIEGIVSTLFCFPLLCFWFLPW